PQVRRPSRPPPPAPTSSAASRSSTTPLVTGSAVVCSRTSFLRGMRRAVRPPCRFSVPADSFVFVADCFLSLCSWVWFGSGACACVRCLLVGEAGRLSGEPAASTILLHFWGVRRLFVVMPVCSVRPSSLFGVRGLRILMLIWCMRQDRIHLWSASLWVCS
ncbi:hypothetical protein BRADI_5g26825v3, partial [Brachypodium distachyon]